MKISSSFGNMDKDKSCQTFKGIPEKQFYIPNAVGKLGKVVGEYVNMPEQKLFLATTALMFQPLIDLKFADEDKKTDAAIKSASKAIAGGVTGVTIRGAFIKITEHFIGFHKHNKLNRYFFPDDAAEMRRTSEALSDVRMKQYCGSLGTLFAVLFMIFFSNSKIDVPLTSDLQDLIGGVVKEDKTWIKSLADVSNNRKEKIKNWFDKKKNFLLKIKNKAVKIMKVLKEDTPAETTKEPPK